MIEENDEVHEVHPIVRPILEEFHEVVLEEIPSGLPPMCDIQHHIDLILGLIFPNKAAYRMSPKKHEQLKRQVDDLIQRGLIRESMSPRVVPALLVPKKNGSWRMCVDNRAVDKITVAYRFPIPRLGDLLDQLHVTSIFLRLI